MSHAGKGKARDATGETREERGKERPWEHFTLSISLHSFHAFLNGSRRCLQVTYCRIHLDDKARSSNTNGLKWSAMVSVYVMVHAVVSRRDIALANKGQVILPSHVASMLII
jgi:hypothetical protein